MIFEIFQNGSDKVNRRLVVIELAMAQAAMVLAAVQGFLPSQDWIPQRILRPLAFALAILSLIIKGFELFFSKTAALYKQTKDQNENDNKPVPQNVIPISQ